MLRSPRNDARPRIARIGMVFSAAAPAVALSLGGLLTRRLVRQRLAERHEERAVERAGRAAYSHHKRGPDALQRLAEILGGKLVDGCQHRFETALHVGAVIAIANGAIEIGELVGARNDTARHGFEQAFAGFAIDRHARPPTPSLPTRLPA